MKRIFNQVLIALVFLSLVTCSKEETFEFPVNEEQCLVKEEIAGGNHRVFYYDKYRRIIRSSQVSGLLSYNYKYDGEKIVMTYDGEGHQTFYSYENNRVIKSSENTDCDGEWVVSQKIEYELDAEGKIFRVYVYDKNNGEFQKGASYSQYEWDSGNVMSITHFESENVAEYTQVYEYDDKNNKNLSYMDKFHYKLPINSKNNIIKEFYQVGEERSLFYEYSYEYNAYGYPINSTKTYPWGDEIRTYYSEYIYECKE